jgi:hypothetical protein
MAAVDAAALAAATAHHDASIDGTLAHVDSQVAALLAKKRADDIMEHKPINIKNRDMSHPPVVLHDGRIAGRDVNIEKVAGAVITLADCCGAGT